MKTFLLHFSVFLLVFCCGMLFVYFQNTSGKPQQKKSSKTPETTLPPLRPAAGRADMLPPLPLPEGMKAEKGSDKSWEYTGEIKSNLVSARARLVSFCCHQGWVPDQKIPLDETLSPREILTFKKGKYALILILWKISGNVTGFAYRRELQIQPIQQVIQ